ncbi:uncharacterized protein LOC134876632 isoform X2 [Eleginops maclovinus]|uniref:uncharacterized protein LOC134876632 isoform X2 n=1 Tax=Eleginops maclovinus TaxID=56733 RepID=UPI0030808C69
MSGLLEMLKNEHPDVAHRLHGANLRTEADMLSLTREDLHQLFPGEKYLKLRRTIFDIIHKQKPVSPLLRHMKQFIPGELFRAAINDNGVLVEYLYILKDMQTHMKDIQSFQDAHICFLRENIQNQPNPGSATNLKEPLSDGRPQEAQDLLQKRRNTIPGVADALQQAGLYTDTKIQSLTQEKLLKPFPPLENAEMMTTIFEIKENQEESIENQPKQECTCDPAKRRKYGHTQGPHGEVLSDLLREIRQKYPAAVDVLRRAGLHTDSDIRSLTREELFELFPDPENLQLRRGIFDMIQKQKSVEHLLRGVYNVTSDTFLSADKRDLVDFLGIMNDKKTQMDNVKRFLDAHIEVLEESTQDPPIFQPESAKPSAASNRNGRLHPMPDGPPKVVKTAKGYLKYQMVVSGRTFCAHEQLMEKVKKEVQDQFALVQSNSNDCAVTIVFCPIVSRMGPDVESALRDVKSDKPVILVLLHHAYEAKFIPNVEQERPNVQLQVNVFFHETKPGLLECDENKAAVNCMKKKLQDFPISYGHVVAAGNSGSTGSNNKSSRSGILNLFNR